MGIQGRSLFLIGPNAIPVVDNPVVAATGVLEYADNWNSYKRQFSAKPNPTKAWDHAHRASQTFLGFVHAGITLSYPESRLV